MLWHHHGILAANSISIHPNTISHHWFSPQSSGPPIQNESGSRGLNRGFGWALAVLSAESLFSSAKNIEIPDY
jgi:hypothetical protein